MKIYYFEINVFFSVQHKTSFASVSFKHFNSSKAGTKKEDQTSQLYKRAALYWTHNHSNVCTKENRRKHLLSSHREYTHFSQDIMAPILIN